MFEAMTVPAEGVLLGIDYGTKRVGVAVSDRYQRYSSPLENYQRQSLQTDERFFRKIVSEFQAVGFVVGLPLHLSGDESEKSREARKYAEWLQRFSGLPVEFQDERFSSAHAEYLLLQTEMTSKQRKARMDKLAAQILLQTFLDARLKANAPIELNHGHPDFDDPDAGNSDTGNSELIEPTEESEGDLQ